MKTLIASFLQFIIFLSAVDASSNTLNVPCGSISGVVSEDTDGDNIGDSGIAGVSISLYTDANMNGMLDGMEGDAVAMIDPDGDGNFDTPATVLTSGPDGAFLFEGVPTGQYIISQEQPAAYLSQVEYDGGDDKDHPDNGQVNSIPAIVDDAEVDSGNNFIEKRPSMEILIFTVPGTLNDLFVLTATGTISGGLALPNNPISTGQTTGVTQVNIGETVTVHLTNNDNNGTLQNYSIIYEAKDEMGVLLERGSTVTGEISIINNNKDATFNFDVPPSEISMKIIIVKQGNVVFMKESIPANDSTDFTFNNLSALTGIPASFTIDAEAVDGVDVDDHTNQIEFQLSGGEQGEYIIKEQSIEGWKLGDISCVTISGDMMEVVDIPNNSITLNISNGDKCICTFTNIKMGAITGEVKNNMSGIPGVSVVLTTSTGTVVNNTVTSNGLTDVTGDGNIDPAGTYYFDNLAPGDYNVLEVQPEGYEDVSEVDGGSDLDKIDNGIINNIPARVLPGEVDLGNDFIEQTAVLAVELGEFDVRTSGCKHAIHLRTLAEVNNEGIEIQHSHNGFSWKSIKTFSGRGTSNIERDLSYTWEGKSRVSFFRLKFTDTNGEHTYSNIIRSTTDCYSNSIIIYPNPSNNEIEVRIEDASSEEFTFQLIDQMGRVVMAAANIEAGLGQSYRMDISSLVPGVYVLKVRDLESGEVSFGRVVRTQ